MLYTKEDQTKYEEGIVFDELYSIVMGKRVGTIRRMAFNLWNFAHEYTKARVKRLDLGYRTFKDGFEIFDRATSESIFKDRNRSHFVDYLAAHQALDAYEEELRWQEAPLFAEARRRPFGRFKKTNLP